MAAYKDTDHYLAVQFHLLRHDLVSGLQKGVAKIRIVEAAGARIAPDKSRPTDVKAIYRNLTIVSPNFGQNGVTFIVR